MAGQPLSEELAQQAADAYFANDRSHHKASMALNLPRPTFQSRLQVAAQRGLLGTKPVLPGFRLAKTTAVTDKDGNLLREFVQQKPESGGKFEVPAGHRIKAVSAYTDADGKIIGQWQKTTEGVLDPLAVAEALKNSFVGFKPGAKPQRAPKETSKDLVTIVPCNDWHIGMFGWDRQVDKNWDLKIAEKTLGHTVEDVIARSKLSEVCVILGGGDLLHADNQRNETTNGTRQDVDGRYPKIVQVANRLKVRAIDAALRRHKRVVVRILPGNHDRHAAVGIAYFLLAWYRNEPRVTVDVDPSSFWWFRFGLCMFGATHGDEAKIEKMPSIMAHRRAAEWGATQFRYVHGFHLHHSAKFATENAGVICEVHQAPVPQESWHFSKGYMSGQSMQAITYHRNRGEHDRVRTAIV